MLTCSVEVEEVAKVVEGIGEFNVSYCSATLAPALGPTLLLLLSPCIRLINAGLCCVIALSCLSGE